MVSSGIFNLKYKNSFLIYTPLHIHRIQIANKQATIF